MKERILIIQTAFLGDSVLTLPMIQKLKEKFPESSISVLCIPATRELFEHSDCIDKVIVFDKKGEQRSLISFVKLIREIRNLNFSRIYSPHRSLRSSLVVFFSKAASTFGFDISALSIVYKTKIEYSGNKHEVARNLDMIGYDTSGSNWKVLPRVGIPVTVKNMIKKLIDTAASLPIAVIAPGSVWNTKVYPEEHFAEVIRFLRRKNYFIFLMGGVNEESVCSRLEGQFEYGVKSLAGKLKVIESVELLSNASILISNDSAPTHLGMIADIPTITIYCSTVPGFGFYPYNGKCRIVSLDGLACKPCGIHGHRTCPLKTFECGFKLNPGTVTAAVRELLAF